MEKLNDEELDMISGGDLIYTADDYAGIGQALGDLICYTIQKFTATMPSKKSLNIASIMLERMEAYRRGDKYTFNLRTQLLKAMGLNMNEVDKALDAEFKKRYRK